MGEVLAQLEQFGPVQLLRASFIVYPLINALHIAALGILLTSVILLDMRVLGALRTLPAVAVRVTFRRLAFAAFSATAITGLALFSIRASDYADKPVFLLKLALIAAAGVNLAVFTVLERRHATPSLFLKFSAVVSLVLWPSVLVCGRLIGFL